MKINKEKEALMSLERLKELLGYNSETGVFVWLVAISKKIKVGKVDGNIDKHGYVKIGINGFYYYAHRLDWLNTYGCFPKGEKWQIDHIDGDRSNNRIENLKTVDHSENGKNQKMFSTNTSGATGVQRTHDLNGTRTGVNYYWVAVWSDKSGKQKKKRFFILYKFKVTVHRLFLIILNLFP